MARASAGDIVLTTGLDNSKLSKELDRLEKELQDKQIDLNIINIDYESAKRQLDNLNKDLEFNKQQEEKIKNELQQQIALREQLKVQGQDLGTTNERISDLYQQLNSISDENIKILDSWNKQNDTIDKIELKLEKQNNDIADTENKIENVKNQMLEASNVDLSNNMKKANTSLESIGKKVSHLGLRLIGINSLYSMVSSSVSRVSNNNEEIKASMNAINNVIDGIIGKLLTALLPIINAITKGIQYIAQGLFGIDISSNNMNKNMKSASGSVSKLRKQLMGFDEMNILNKDGTTGGIGGKVEVTSPTNADLTKIKNDIQNFFDRNHIPIKLDYVEDAIKNPIEYIKTAWNEFILPNISSGPASGLELIFGKDNPIAKTIQTIFKKINPIAKGISIWEWFFGKGKQGTIKDLKDLVKKTDSISKELVSQIKESVKSSSVVFKDGLVELHTNTGEVIKMTHTEYEELMSTLGLETKQTGDNISAVMNSVKGQIITGNDETKNTIEKNSNDVKNTIKDTANGVEGAVKGSLNNIDDKNTTTTNNITEDWGHTSKGIKDTANGVEGAVTGALNNVEKKSQSSSKQSVKNIEDEYDKLPNWVKNNVFVQLLKEFGLLGEGTGQNFGNALKKVVNKVIDKIQTTINDTLSAGAKVIGLKTAPKVDFSQYKFKLAKGGIINKPGKGVMVDGAIAGERGREAVLPLTDSQQMEYLGREIAKHIVVNLTNVTELDGRQIARSVSQVMNDMNFASNGGVI